MPSTLVTNTAIWGVMRQHPREIAYLGLEPPDFIDYLCTGMYFYDNFDTSDLTAW